MKRWISVGLIGSMVALAACRKKPPAPAEAPTIRVEGSQVLVDGKVAGSIRAIEETGRLTKIDELFAKLKEDREAFKTANPSKPFPGRATISVHPETPALVFKAIFQTAAFAGYPYLSVGTQPDSVPVQPILPKPPAETREPRVALHLMIEETSVTLSERRAAAVIHEERFDPNDAGLGNRLERAVVDVVLRHDVRALPVVDLIVHADNRTPFTKLAMVLRGLHAARERLAGPGDEDGAFILRLSMS